MLKARLLVFWVSATVALVVLAPFVLAIVQALVPLDGMHEGEV